MPGRRKAADEMFCRSCGEAIKRAASICPHCGVPTGSKTQTASQRSAGDQEYTTTVSESWYYGVALAVGLWAFVLLLVAAAPDLESVIAGFLLLGGWILMPISIYFDAQYVRANSEWRPDSALWTIGSMFWFVNVVVGAAYLYRRHEVLGTP